MRSTTFESVACSNHASSAWSSAPHGPSSSIRATCTWSITGAAFTRDQIACAATISRRYSVFSAAEPTAGFATTGAFFPVAIASASRKARFSRHEHHSLSSARTRCFSLSGHALRSESGTYSGLSHLAPS